jgi:hypothetical protein
MATNRRDLDVVNVLERIANSSVVCKARVVVVDSAVSCCIGEVFSVFNKSAELDSIKNVWFFLAAEAVTFSVAATFDVEDVLVCPNVLIVSDKGTFWITGKSGFSRS